MSLSDFVSAVPRSWNLQALLPRRIARGFPPTITHAPAPTARAANSSATPDVAPAAAAASGPSGAQEQRLRS